MGERTNSSASGGFAGDEPSQELSRDALRLAAAASALGDDAWARAAAAVADSEPPAGDAQPPTYRELALTGIAVVLALAHDDRWGEAQEQARFLARQFDGAEAPVRTIAGEGFRGLVSSAASADRQGMQDFAAFVLELYG